MSGQVDPDDVLTKEEQIYLLVEAKEKCQRDIKAQLEKIKGTILTLRMGGASLGTWLCHGERCPLRWQQDGAKGTCSAWGPQGPGMDLCSSWV